MNYAANHRVLFALVLVLLLASPAALAQKGGASDLEVSLLACSDTQKICVEGARSQEPFLEPNALSARYGNLVVTLVPEADKTIRVALDSLVRNESGAQVGTSDFCLTSTGAGSQVRVSSYPLPTDSAVNSLAIYVPVNLLTLPLGHTYGVPLLFRFRVGAFEYFYDVRHNKTGADRSPVLWDGDGYTMGSVDVNHSTSGGVETWVFTPLPYANSPVNLPNEASVWRYLPYGKGKTAQNLWCNYGDFILPFTLTVKRAN
jgi:hypothetical protein